MPKISGLGTESVAHEGISDAKGNVTSTGETSDGFVFCGASKEGYYRTSNIRFIFKEKKEGRWQPWNPIVEVVLKRIVKPIPMYAKRVETKIPADATEIGYDLEIGDWIVPYGKGRVSDFIFAVDRTITSESDFRATLRLGFSNKGDGVLPQPDAKSLGSELLLPPVAPENGYESKRTWTSGESPNASGPDTFVEPPDAVAYFFRVRTVLDEKGKVKSALYGKIYQDVRLYVGTKAPKAGLGFTYYLNPTANDRNVEFDPHRNLFTDLRSLDQPTAP